CFRFFDFLVHMVFTIKPIATLIKNHDSTFKEKAKLLTDLFTDKFPISAVIEIEITKVDKIEAPSYFLYPDTTEQSQIENAMRTYKVKPIE
ncbi:MAG: hypothetical protein ACTHMM_11155, partial [Agriterribacter sp.]